MSKAFVREDGYYFTVVHPAPKVEHREQGSYNTEPAPPTENPCQVPWGCTDKTTCRNQDCHYGKINLAKERTEDMRGIEPL